MRKWGQGNSLEAEEEDYFNKSDEEDSPKVVKPSVISPSVNMLKRKRGKFFPGPSSTAPKQLRPSIPRQPMQSLVDYGDDDEEDITNAASANNDQLKSVSVNSPPNKPVDWFAGLQIPSPMASLLSSPNSGKASSPKRNPLDPLDEVDSDITEFLPDRLSASSPPRIGEKRRREDEEDEDEMLERLVKSKKPNVAANAQKDDLLPKSLGTGKMSGMLPSGPGKLKLKLGSTTSFSLASQLSPSPTSSPNNHEKDGDSG